MRKKPSSPAGLKLDQGACVYGAGVLLKHLQALAEETEGVRAGSEDIEFIHRARVASRRLRAALPLFESCLPEKKAKKWLKQIKNVTRSLGEARDADVQIDLLNAFYQELPDKTYRPGIRRLILRLRQKREALQAPVTQAMEELAQSGVLEEMGERLRALAGQGDTVYIYTQALYQHSFQSISSRLDDLLTYDAIVDQPEKVTELHEMRIAAKQLRYTIENFAPLYASQLKPYLQTVRKIQELLGNIHDCDVWQAFIPQFLNEERQRTIDYFGHSRPFKRLVAGIQFFEQDRRQARCELYETFVREWQRWKQEEIWTGLRATIQVPFPASQNIYPPPAPKNTSA